MNIKENNLRSLRKSGFTLLEMLLVIAIIAILAGIVIIAINPARQIAQANNAQRRSDVLAVLNAVHQYNIDNAGDITDLSIPVLVEGETCAANGEQICKDDTNDTTCDIDLSTHLASSTAVTYISAIPVDPLATTSEEGSGYYIAQESNNRITVCAPLAQNDETVTVTR